jgi:hypothetical protein
MRAEQTASSDGNAPSTSSLPEQTNVRKERCTLMASTLAPIPEQPAVPAQIVYLSATGNLVSTAGTSAQSIPSGLFTLQLAGGAHSNFSTMQFGNPDLFNCPLNQNVGLSLGEEFMQNFL